MDLLDLLFYGVFALIFVGSWIGQLLKKQAEDRASLEHTREHGAPGQATPTTRQRLDKLAEKRRAQLQRPGHTAQRRDIPHGAAQAGPMPQNMTLAERIERAKAQQVYRKRAEAMQREKQQHQARLKAQGQPQTPGRSQPGQPAKQQHTGRATVAPTQRQPAPPSAPLPAAKTPAPPGTTTTRLVQDAEEQHHPHAAIPHTQTHAQRAPLKTHRLTPGSLRDAFVLKEIIDPPIALR